MLLAICFFSLPFRGREEFMRKEELKMFTLISIIAAAIAEATGE